MCGSIIKKDISSNSKINFNNVNERMITGVEHIIKKYSNLLKIKSDIENKLNPTYAPNGTYVETSSIIYNGKDQYFYY